MTKHIRRRWTVLMHPLALGAFCLHSDGPVVHVLCTS